MPRTCIFCDNPLTGLRAEEHVIPRWLMEYLGVTDDQLYLAVANSQDDTIVKDRTHVAGNFVEGRVCGDCNNGWMNNLEKQTRELLKPLIEGTTNLLSISDDERTTLAKWARIRTTNRLVSSSTRGRPQDLRNFDPSNLLAMSFRAQASSVSGFATAANSSKASRLSLWAISANVAFSASDNNNLPLIWVLRMRFSAARYSFLSCSSWSTVPVM